MQQLAHYSKANSFDGCSRPVQLTCSPREGKAGKEIDSRIRKSVNDSRAFPDEKKQMEKGVQKPKKIAFKLLDNPSFKTIVKMVQCYVQLKEPSPNKLSCLLSCLQAHLEKNPINHKLLNFILSIQDDPLKKHALNVLSRVYKSSFDPSKNLDFFDVQKHIKEKPSLEDILMVKRTIRDSTNRSDTIDVELFGDSYSIFPSDKNLVKLFDRIDWLHESYNQAASSIVKQIADIQVKERLIEVMEYRQFFLMICEHLEKKYPDRIEKIKSKISWSWQEDTIVSVEKFLSSLDEDEKDSIIGQMLDL